MTISLACVFLRPPPSKTTTTALSRPLVDAVAWAEIDPQLFNTGADGFAVAEVAQPDPVQSCAYDANGPLVV